MRVPMPLPMSCPELGKANVAVRTRSVLIRASIILFVPPLETPEVRRRGAPFFTALVRLTERYGQNSVRLELPLVVLSAIEDGV